MSSVPHDLGRFLFLVPWLTQHPDGVPVEEVCSRLEISPAELHRLVERVAFVGTPDGTPDEMVDLYIEGDRMFVALAQRFVRAPRFSPEEMLALLVVLAPLRDAPVPRLAAEATALTERLEGLASDRAGQLARAMDTRVLAEGEGREPREVLARFERAVRERRVCDVDYYTASRDALGTRRLRPVALVERRGAWYVIGDDEKTFKVERVKRVDLTDEHFEVPPHVDLDRYRRGELFQWERASGEREYAQRDAVLRDAAGVRRWPLDAGGGVQLRTYVRARRGEVEWLEPADEREAFLAETRELLARYTTPRDRRKIGDNHVEYEG